MIAAAFLGIGILSLAVAAFILFGPVGSLAVGGVACVVAGMDLLRGDS